jgi:hypothetical protein
VRLLLKRVRWRRLVKRVLGVVGILAASYLVVANILLRTGLLRNAVNGSSLSFAILGTSTALHLDYTSAYSIFPGRAHVEGLTIRGRERTVEWRLTLDRADVTISLAGLLHRTFHVTRLRSSGLTLRARLRLDRAHATPDVIAALPPIAGFADPPLLDDAPPPPPLPDANYDLWMLDLEDIDVEHVREVWIYTVRAEGDTRVRGRWLFRPQRWLDVGPSTVDANGVDISYGSQPLASGVQGSFRTTVHPFDVREANGLSTFDHVSHDGDLRGRAIIATALRLLAPSSGVRFTQCEGPFDAHVVLDHGRLAEGTRVRTEATNCQIESDELALEARLRTELGVEGDLATIDTRASGLRVSRRGVEQARVTSIAATVTTKHMRIAQVFDDAQFTVDVEGAETNDLGAWGYLLPSTPPFVIRSGIVSADGHANGSLVDRSGSGKLKLRVRRLTVEDGSERFVADFASDAKVGELSLAGGTVAGAATIAVRDLSVKSAGGGAAVLVVPQLTLLASHFALGPSGANGHVSIDLPRAEVADLGRLHELFPLPLGLAVERGWGRARLRADIELGSGSAQGDGEVIVRGGRVRAGSTELFGDLDCAVRARRTGAGNSTDLSGSTLAITHAGSGAAAKPEDAWWGNAALRDATLRTDAGVRFDAKAHLSAKDASPATALVSQNMGVPAWAANVFRMPVLDAGAEVRFAPSSFEVRRVVARGGSVSLQAEYAKRDHRQDGGVLMDLGWIDLGYDLGDGAAGLVLVGPQAWYAKKTATMSDAVDTAGRKADEAEQLARYAGMTPLLRKDEARALAARCRLEVRSCDGASIESLLRAAADAGERDTLRGITYAPFVVAAAKGGTDGPTLDPLVVGSVAEVLRIGGESTLEDIPSITRGAAARDSGAARGRVIAVTGRVSAIRREGLSSIGLLTSTSEPVYFITPFPTNAVPETLAHFRGVFVQRYAPTDQPPDQRPSLVLVGAFDR